MVAFALPGDLASGMTTVDKQIDALNRATDFIRAETEQQITAGSSTVVLYGTGSRFLQLPQTPVTAVTALVVDGITLTADLHYTWAADGLVQSLRGFWRRRCPVTVTFDHGYATVPDELVRLCASIADRLLSGAGSNLASESVSTGPFSRSVTYSDIGSTLTDDDRALLEKYRLGLAP